MCNRLSQPGVTWVIADKVDVNEYEVTLTVRACSAVIFFLTGEILGC